MTLRAERSRSCLHYMYNIGAGGEGSGAALVEALLDQHVRVRETKPSTMYTT
ncbi:unnamed protein product [uncultured bacterium]|nr:unnamed protein product [uncultured bacterium]